MCGPYWFKRVKKSIFAPWQKKIKHINLGIDVKQYPFLKKKFNYLNVLPWNSLQSEIGKYDIIINATSLGLKNGQDFDFDFSKCKDDAIYIDTIYNPLKTKTYKFLGDKGVKVFNGLDMFIYQGQKSFYLWNKINPEIDDDLVNLLLSKLK